MSIVVDMLRNRSPVYGKAGAVASSQPLATEAGLSILRQGGTAADAAIAVSAALCVTEPSSTGVGGDCFALVYDAQTSAVKALLGCGRSPRSLTLDMAREAAVGGHLPKNSPHVVTVPGAVAGWSLMLEKFGSGRLSWDQIFDPAIQLAEHGFPIAPVTAAQWAKSVDLLRDSCNGSTFLVRGKSPEEGTIFRNPDLACTLKEIASKGAEGFYCGRIAEEIVATLRKLGGVMKMSDLADCRAEVADSISTTYRGRRIHQVPPPTHGITVLLALNLLEQYIDDVQSLGTHGCASHLHALIDVMRIAYSDAAVHVADPHHSRDRSAELLSKEYARKRAKELITDHKCVSNPVSGLAPGGTVQFCTVDKYGNAVCMVQSNYIGFGSGHVPYGSGFTLHNRGLNFSLDASHPNALAGGKRPYHTIIPGMMTDAATGSLIAALGCMGSFQQPQGHLQIISNMVDWGMNPQQALDAPRFRIRGKFGAVEGEHEEEVALENASDVTCRDLAKRGHMIVRSDEIFFGRGQVIARNSKTGVVCAGTDCRADGIAACEI